MTFGDYAMLIIKNANGSYTVSYDGEIKNYRTFYEVRKFVEKVERTRRYPVTVKERRKQHE